MLVSDKLPSYFKIVMDQLYVSKTFHKKRQQFINGPFRTKAKKNFEANDSFKKQQKKLEHYFSKVTKKSRENQLRRIVGATTFARVSDFDTVS